MKDGGIKIASEESCTIFFRRFYLMQSLEYGDGL
jgi:hypothetical protein